MMRNSVRLGSPRSWILVGAIRKPSWKISDESVALPPGTRPAHVGVMQDQADERDPLATRREDGQVHEDVVQVAGPRIGVVVGEDVAGMDVVAEFV